MNKETGGPAFMVAELANVQHEGMSLRDYFAAKAMSYWLSLPIDSEQLKRSASEAYKVADAMLKARKQ